MSSGTDVYLVHKFYEFLILGTRYKFRVAAENRHGISPESQAVTTRMLEEGKRFCDFGPVADYFSKIYFLKTNLK